MVQQNAQLTTMSTETQNLVKQILQKNNDVDYKLLSKQLGVKETRRDAKPEPQRF